MDIAVALKNEKLAKISSVNREENKIYVDHITIRESIFFLLVKFLLIEGFAAGGLLTLCVIIFSTNFIYTLQNAFSYVLYFFIFLVILKTSIMIYITIEWLEDYYEITTKEIIHKRGLFFKKDERFTLQHIGSITLQQGFFGRLFHYGTIILYDWINGKNEYLPLIHNPIKYHQILHYIIPEADDERVIFREGVVEEDE